MLVVPRLALAAAVAAAGLGLAATGPAAEARAAAPGAAARAHITLSPATGPPDAVVRVSGSGFATREIVHISLDDQDHTVAHCNRRGSFSGAQVKVGSVAPGRYQVTAVGRRTGRQASAAFTVHDNWAQFGYGPQRTAANGSVSATSVITGKHLWSVTVGAMPMDSDPAVADGVVYVGASDGNLYAFDAATGSQLWAYNTGSPIQSSPAVADGRVYVGSDNGYEYAFAVPPAG